MTTQPNAVIVWNQATLNAIQNDDSDPLIASRGLAMVQSAVYDAVNAIEGTPAYLVKVSAAADASVPAAVDQAAHDVLSYLYPRQQASFDALLATQIGLLTAGQGTTDGEATGAAAAAAIIQLRTDDGYLDFVEYDPGSVSTVPGVYVLTPPAYAPALEPQWGNVTPWGLTSGNQFDSNKMATGNGIISSHHPGGANVGWFDAHVSHLSNTTSIKLLRGLLTAAGGEPVSDPNQDPYSGNNSTRY